MTLIKSISGFRGTIGGEVFNNLTPLDLVKLTSAYAEWLKSTNSDEKLKVILGRDARISGPMVSRIVEGALMGCGIDVINIGLASTPTTELAVPAYNADGGIILTASHNPKQWNALKLLNSKGEFINAAEGRAILDIADEDTYTYCDVDSLGESTTASYDDEHIKHVLSLRMVNVEAIRAAKFKVAVDGVNSVGGTIIPALLRELGVEVLELNCTPDGDFAHNPEPLKENLGDISRMVVESGADMGIVVDPDVDRLALVMEDGEMFGEEYTLVACADYILSKESGVTVSNLSSSRALSDVTKSYGGEYYASAVGEVNVVSLMKEKGAIIGGEGNGGIIYPESHYGRDALVGVGLFLSLLAERKLSLTALRATYPAYFISKNRIDLTPDVNVGEILQKIKSIFSNERVNDIDGVKIDFADGWVHLRSSNTEPIIRVYSESSSEARANELAKLVMDSI